MNLSFLCPHVEILLSDILKFKYPADSTVRFYFKNNPRLGSKDRSYIADAVFSVLRNLGLFRHLAQSSGTKLEHSLAVLGFLYALLPLDSKQIDNHQRYLTSQELAWLEHLSKINLQNLKPATRYSLTDWLWQSLVEEYGEENAHLFAQSSLQPSNLDVRVNILKANTEQTLDEFYRQNIMAGLTKYAPYALRLDAKASIHQTSTFEDGWFEIQDEGSQLICHLLNPKRGEMVVDFCAGAGGKTLALGAIMRSTGRIYAFDVDDKRLKKIKPRLARSGLSNVYTALIQHENDTPVKRLYGKIDKVLLDVPCSGMGTLRRNPDLKWRQTPQGVKELQIKQKNILQQASKLLKSGGYLVYATCSLLKQENEDIVLEFLNNNPHFKCLNAYDVLAKQNINVEKMHTKDDNYLRLYSHMHKSDGFFAALLQKD
jgi:16S rRNA (cytosine967-C5)-methyltransferase